jgi:RNA polymerase sigma-70 factor, ECF subfamily
MPDETVDPLLERARAGDAQALEALLERHQEQIYRFGMKMCRNPEDAKDILQDTLIGMARGVRNFRGGSSLSTWLYTIARGACIKRRRRSKFAPELDGDATDEVSRLAHDARLPDEALAARRLEVALNRAIASLEPTSREVLVLRDVEGLTAPEVAEVLGIGVPAVKSRLHRARLTVRAHMEPMLGGGEQEPAQGQCADLPALFSRHLEGEVGSEDCAKMEQHVQGCARCREACDSFGRVLALCHTARGGDALPESVQLAVKRALRNVLDARR